MGILLLLVHLEMMATVMVLGMSESLALMIMNGFKQDLISMGRQLVIGLVSHYLFQVTGILLPLVLAKTVAMVGILVTFEFMPLIAWLSNGFFKALI
jgi:hypothetical protein